MNGTARTGVQRGVSLVELLVAMLIASVLLIGIVAVFGSSSRAGRTQQVVAGLSDSGRFAVDTLARDLRMTGYRDSDWTLGAIVNAIVAVDGDPAAGGDTVTIRFEGPRDCNFTAAPAGLVTNAYAIDAGEFQCNGETITTGVEQMQIYFGEDTDGDSVVNRYLAPGTAGLDMSRVLSLRVHLLVRSDAVNAAAGDQSFYFDNAVQVPVGDGQVRREYSVTIALRNPV